MKKIIILFSLFILGLIDVNATTSAQNVSFVRCVDGDTAVFLVGEEEIKFRFLAIDTPETVHPTQNVEKYGKNASEYTCNKLSNATEIIVEYEDANKTDKYGRHLGWIWVDKSLLQKELIEVGYAEVAYIYGNYRYTDSLCLVQKTAKDNLFGLWNDGHEEGYCSTVDLTSTTNNIDYEKIENISKDDLEDTQKIENTLKEIDDWIEKISGYADKNEDTLVNTFLYVMLGLAIVSIVLKKKK